jgi:hypothetical protein
MKTNFAELVLPCIQAGAAQIELSCKEEGLSARGYSAGEILCCPSGQKPTSEDWKITVDAKLLAPIKDLGNVDLEIGDNDGASCLRISSDKGEFELPAFDVVVPSNDHVETTEPLLASPVLKEALQFLAPYHNKGSKALTGVDHGCLYLYVDSKNRLRMASTSSYVLAHVSGTALPTLEDKDAEIIRSGRSGFRLIPWELLTLGTPLTLSICREGAVIFFDEGITVIASWADAKVPDWTVLTCPSSTEGWHGELDRDEFTSQFKLVAAYTSIVGDEAIPVVSSAEKGINVSIRGGRGRIETEISAEVKREAEVRYETPASNIHLRGFGSRVGVVIPKELGFLEPEDMEDGAVPSMASSMLFHEDVDLGEGVLEKRVSVVLSEIR